MMVQRKIETVGILASGVALMLAIVLFATSQAVAAQESEPASADTANEDADYKRKSLSRLRQEMYDAEEAFYAEFNAVNSDDEFDVRCKLEAPLGSRRKEHACKADFLWKYEAEAARRFNSQIDGAGGGGIHGNAQLGSKQERLRNMLSSAIAEHADVQRSFALLARAKKNYEAKLQDR